MRGDYALVVPTSASDIAGWLRFFRQLTFLRYVVVSVAALAVDMAVFLGLLQTGLPSPIAAAIGYSVGIAAHWTIPAARCSGPRLKPWNPRTHSTEGMFVVSALLGLIVTMSIVGVGDAVGLDPRIAKVMAIGISFIITYYYATWSFSVRVYWLSDASICRATFFNACRCDLDFGRVCRVGDFA